MIVEAGVTLTHSISMVMLYKSARAPADSARVFAVAESVGSLLAAVP